MANHHQMKMFHKHFPVELKVYNEQRKFGREEKRRKCQFHMDGIEHYRVHLSQSVRAKRSIDHLCTKKRSQMSERKRENDAINHGGYAPILIGFRHPQL